MFAIWSLLFFMPQPAKFWITLGFLMGAYLVLMCDISIRQGKKYDTKQTEPQKPQAIILFHPTQIGQSTDEHIKESRR